MGGGTRSFLTVGKSQLKEALASIEVIVAMAFIEMLYSPALLSVHLLHSAEPGNRR
jgi:hypothetical protein